MTMLQRRVKEIIKQHNSIRAAAQKLDVDYTYLYRLSTGERTDPNDDLLKRLGLRRVVTFVSTRKK